MTVPRADEIDREIGLRIRERRIELGLTQQHLAEKTGTTYQQQHKYERGLNRIAVGRLLAISRALKVPPEFFLDGLDGSPAPDPAHGNTSRTQLDLNRNFQALEQEARTTVAALVRMLAGAQP